MEKIKQQLIRALTQVVILLQKQLKILQTQVAIKQAPDKNEIIYQTAKSLLGTELGTTKKELRCADALNKLWIIATGKVIGGTTSTGRMFASIQKDKRFVEVELVDRKRGDIILSPAFPKLFWSKVESGHCGVLLDNDKVASNNSLTGKLEDHWEVDDWIFYYGKNGFQVLIYRLK